MEVHKRNPKGGGFLNLFDWNGKSRKKLFADNSDRPENANQGKIKQDILAAPIIIHRNAADENASSSNGRRTDWKCNSSSSLMNSEGHGNRAPGVVARLMGLDSMPTPIAPDSRSTSFSGFNFPRSSQYYDRPEAFTRDPRIERFQTEVLPPRSAKPIPVTHHKLLSPIKNPAFVPTKDAARIMEAAVKIIGASTPEAARGQTGPKISSSVPLRIQDLKAKLQAQQPKNLSSFKIVTGKSNDPSPQQPVEARVVILRRGLESDRGISSLSASDKMRSFLLADRTKSNLLRREGTSRTFNRNLPVERELKSSQRKTSTNQRSNSVLRQNHQKQNSLSDRFGTVSKNSSGPKTVPSKTRTVNKVPTRAESMSMKTARTNTPKNLSSSSSSSSSRTLSQKKGTADREIGSTRSIATNVLISNDQRSTKSRIGTDVISFTFSSPIKRSSEAQSPVRTVASIDSFASGKSLTFLSPADTVMGESSLSALLEQKLRELRDRVESYIVDNSFTSTSSLREEEEEDHLSTCTSGIQEPVSSANHLRSAKVGADFDEMSSLSDLGYSSTVNRKQKSQAQVVEAMKDHSTIATSSRTGKGADLQLLYVPYPEASSAAGSSPASTVTCSGREELVESIPAMEFLGVDDSRTEFSDTISTSSVADTRENHGALASVDEANFHGSTNREIEYIRDILGKAESMREGCSSTHPGEIINPSFFDELESRGNQARSISEEECNKLRRKVLFDYVSDYIVLRCQDFLIGAPKGWARFTALFSRKRVLADEIFREVSGGNCIGDMMVDVLVDEDMSSKYGKWVDFGVEIFEEGVDIGQGILSTLVDELVADFLPVSG